MIGSFETAAMLNIILSIVCIAISWWSLQTLRFDKLVKNPNGPQAKLLQILLAIFIGNGVSRFFMEYLASSLQLGNLFS
ncbi:MAG: DUF1146 family protein [Clostridia bacterium]